MKVVLGVLAIGIVVEPRITGYVCLFVFFAGAWITACQLTDKNSRR